LAAGMTIGGFSPAAAQPGDFGAIPISPKRHHGFGGPYRHRTGARSERSAGRDDGLHPP
jgi:hypothetical protein